MIVCSSSISFQGWFCMTDADTDNNSLSQFEFSTREQTCFKCMKLLDHWTQQTKTRNVCFHCGWIVFLWNIFLFMWVVRRNLLQMNLLDSVCNDGSNPCKLDDPSSPNSYFVPWNGYHCLDGFDGGFICTCPDNSTTRHRPCRKFQFHFSIRFAFLFKAFVIRIQIHVVLTHWLLPVSTLIDLFPVYVTMETELCSTHQNHAVIFCKRAFPQTWHHSYTQNHSAYHKENFSIISFNKTEIFFPSNTADGFSFISTNSSVRFCAGTTSEYCSIFHCSIFFQNQLCRISICTQWLSICCLFFIW